MSVTNTPTNPPEDSHNESVLAVNAWADLDNGQVIAAFRLSDTGYWHWMHLTHDQAVQLADQLYLITKEGP